MTRVSRREVLLGLGGVVAGAGMTAGTAAAIELASADGTEPSGQPGTSSDSVPASGDTQAGVDRPGTPQPFGLLAVLDLPEAEPAEVGPRIARLGNAVLELTGATTGDAPLPGGPGDLTVSVGLGPRIVAACDPTLPGATSLPRFTGDDAIPARRIGGDVLLALHASDPAVLPLALRRLRGALGAATQRWSEHCYRGPGEGTVARNPLGFHDGIAVPHGPEELSREVWLPGPADGGDPRVAGGTICVLRRLTLDTERFTDLGIKAQESVIGRRRSDGAPLSGGILSDDVDLRAKTPEGEYLVPAGSHVRAAHPSFTGSGLMLRRGYSYSTSAGGADDPGGQADPSSGETGLFFLCFQRELDTFVRTQLRLDETDALMDFVTPTASATFLILPGFDPNRPLGSTLFP